MYQELVRCHQELVRCHQELVRCHQELVRCHQELVRCHQELVRCHQELVRCHQLVFFSFKQNQPIEGGSKPTIVLRFEFGQALFLHLLPSTFSPSLSSPFWVFSFPSLKLFITTYKLYTASSIHQLVISSTNTTLPL